MVFTTKTPVFCPNVVRRWTIEEREMKEKRILKGEIRLNCAMVRWTMATLALVLVVAIVVAIGRIN